MSIEVALKPSYEVPLIGVVGANAQNGFSSNKISLPFRINGLVIVFDDNHINNVLHYFLIDDTKDVSATGMSSGTNLISRYAPFPYFVGHSMIRKIHYIHEYPSGEFFVKVHVVNNNAYQINVNASVIIEVI